MIRRFRASAAPMTLLVLLVMALSGGSLAAQSVTLPFTDSGAVVRGDGSIIPDDGFGLTFGAGYTISGVLDLGLRFGADIIASESSVTSDIGMFYGFAPLKQSPGVPVSAQIYGSYTFRAGSSDFLTRNRLLHQSRGYTLGITLVRDNFFNESVGIRTGALSEYSNYLATTTVGFDPTGFTGTSEVDYGEYPQTARLSGFVYGGYLGVIVRSSRGRALLIGSSVLLDPHLAVEIRPDVQLLIGR